MHRTGTGQNAITEEVIVIADSDTSTDGTVADRSNSVTLAQLDKLTFSAIPPIKNTTTTSVPLCVRHAIACRSEEAMAMAMVAHNTNTDCILLPLHHRSVIDLSSIDFDRWQSELEPAPSLASPAGLTAITSRDAIYGGGTSSSTHRHRSLGLKCICHLAQSVLKEQEHFHCSRRRKAVDNPPPSR